MFEAEILIKPGDKEYVSCALNFMTFGNTSQKLWHVNVRNCKYNSLSVFVCEWSSFFFLF